MLIIEMTRLMRNVMMRARVMMVRMHPLKRRGRGGGERGRVGHPTKSNHHLQRRMERRRKSKWLGWFQYLIVSVCIYKCDNMVSIA